MRPAPSRREGSHRFAEKRPRIFVLALRHFAAIQPSENQLSRDFRRRSIFDFYNKICQKRKSTDILFDHLIGADE